MPEYYNVTEAEATALIDRRLAEAFGPLYRKPDPEAGQGAGDSLRTHQAGFFRALWGGTEDRG